MKNADKIILDLCGGTGAWSRPYLKAGYRVYNITLPDYDLLKTQIEFGEKKNYMVFQGKHLPIFIPVDKVYGILSAPPCTQFSFARTNAKKKRDLLEGMELVIQSLKIIWFSQKHIEKDTQKKSPLNFWCLENPNGMLKWFLGKPVFEFHPYEFGDNYKKKTHLWGYFNIPEKNPIECDKPKFDQLKTKEIHPEYYGKLNRTERRAITPSGFANAFFKANQ